MEGKITNPFLESMVTFDTKSKNPSPPFWTSLFMFRLSKLNKDNNVFPLIFSGHDDWSTG